MNEDELYVTGIALSQFVLGAEKLGIDARHYMTQAGLDPEQHLHPQAKVPSAEYEQALLSMILDSDDELLGFHIGEQVMLPLYGIIVTLALSSTTLLEAIRSAITFQALVAGNVGGISIEEKGSSVTLTGTMAHQNPVIRRHIMECVISLLARVFRLITGQQDLRAERVHFEHRPASAHAREVIETLIQGPVHWGSGPTRIVLAKQTVAMPFQGHGGESKRLIEEHARKQVEALQARDNVIDEIKWHMRDLIVSGVPQRASVAQRMSISIRTLDRRLADVSLSWQGLLDNLRSQLAREYLAEPSLTVSNIAQRLGFADVRAFQRRFRVWTGMSPSAFRASIQRQQ